MVLMVIVMDSRKDCLCWCWRPVRSGWRMATRMHIMTIVPVVVRVVVVVGLGVLVALLLLFDRSLLHFFVVSSPQALSPSKVETWPFLFGWCNFFSLTFCLFCSHTHFSHNNLNLHSIYIKNNHFLVSIDFETAIKLFRFSIKFFEFEFKSFY